MRVCVAGGARGSGKTTCALGMFLALEKRCQPVQYVDCDVLDPTFHLLPAPREWAIHEAIAPLPRVDRHRCTLCGECDESCASLAMHVSARGVEWNPAVCRACGACAESCPSGAVALTPARVGEVRSAWRNGASVLGGAPAAGGAVTALIRTIKEESLRDGAVIIDCPGGAGPPAVESVRDCDFCLLVVEASTAGLRQLMDALMAFSRLDVPCGVVVNRYDRGTREPLDYCQDNGVPVLMCIPSCDDAPRGGAGGLPGPALCPDGERRFAALWDRAARTAARLARR